MVIQDRLTGSQHSADIAVGHGLIHVVGQSTADGLRELEIKAAGVSGIQLQNRNSLGLHPQGLQIQRAADVRMDLRYPV